MNQPEFDDFLPLFDEANRLYLHGDLAGALTLATEGQQRFPEESAPLLYLRATLRARMNDVRGALDLLAEAMDKGYWYPDGRWASDAFGPLQSMPEFVRLRAISNGREAKALVETKPELILLPPEKKPGEAEAAPESLPVLIALHSSGYSVRHTAPYWRPAVSKGWLLALPQSGQIIGYDSYAWADHATAEAELKAHLESIRQQAPINPARIVLAGKSQGAETAIRLALSGAIPACGFIAIVPSGAMMLHSTQWEELVQRARRDLRGYVLIGGREAHFAAGGRRLVEMLRTRGIACALDYHPAVRHEFPLNFRARLAFMLDYVVGAHEAAG